VTISRRVAYAVLAAAMTFAIGPASAIHAATTTTGTTSTTGTSSTTGTTPTTTKPRDPTAPGVTLVTQPPWIATQGVEVLGLHLDDPAIAAVPDAAVEITVHRSVSSRTEFNRAITSGALPGVRARLRYPLSTLGVNKRGAFGIAFGLSGSGQERAVAVDEAGVYPVEVGVVDSGQSRTTFVTWMVVVNPDNAAGVEPLRVSWIWQLVAAPVQDTGAAVNKSTLDEMQRGGRLDRIATLLARAGRFPLTVGIGPETLSSWIDQSRTKPALRRGAARARIAARRASVQLLPEPYVPIDGPTIEAEHLGDHVPDEYVAGSNAIEAATGEIPDPRTAFEDPVDDATVRRLTQLGVRRFVIEIPRSNRSTNRAPRRNRSRSRRTLVRCRRSHPTAASNSSSQPTARPRCAHNECWPASRRSPTRHRRKPAASCSRCPPTGSPTSRP
jgi:hypothetical protein